MKKLNLILLSAGAMLALSGCAEIGAEGQPITYAKAPADVYKTNCASCHGDKAQGDESKKAPALAQRQAGELELALYNANNKFGEVKEHIRKDVFDAKAMAAYLEKEFFTLPPKEAPVTETPTEAPASEPAPVAEPAPEANATN